MAPKTKLVFHAAVIADLNWGLRARYQNWKLYLTEKSNNSLIDLRLKVVYVDLICRFNLNENILFSESSRVVYLSREFNEVVLCMIQINIHYTYYIYISNIEIPQPECDTPTHPHPLPLFQLD